MQDDSLHHVAEIRAGSANGTYERNGLYFNTNATTIQLLEDFLPAPSDLDRPLSYSSHFSGRQQTQTED